jgi:hypothetical protein
MQVQVQVAKNVQDQDYDDLDLFAGVIAPLSSPFNIFLRLRDIQDQNSLVYFYVYALGQNRTVLWGVYDVASDEFLIDQSCQYDANDLLFMSKTWQKNDYKYYGNTVQNRIASNLGLHMIFDRSEEKNKMLQLYKDFKVAYVAQSDMALLDELLAKIISVGKRLMKIDVAYVLTRRKMVKDMFTGDITADNYVYIHLFVLIMLDFEDYRTAKYMLSNVEDEKARQGMQKVVAESFLYLWMRELGENVSIDPTEMIDKIVELKENEINRSDLSNEVTAENEDLIKQITDSFQRFIGKSKYAKLKYAKNLEKCYVSGQYEACENSDEEQCGIFDHGAKRSSRFDLT